MTVASVANTIVGFINMVIKVVAVGAVILFFSWLVQFIYNAGDENKIKQGRSFLLWGLLGLFILFSLWGILTLMCETFLGSACGAGSSLPSGGGLG